MVWRAVNTIAGRVADRIASADLYVVNSRNGEVINTSVADKALSLLTDTPDGITPALTWVEDMARDLLMTGNALAKVVRPASIPLGLMRLDSESARMVADDGGIYYNARLAQDSVTGDDIPLRDVIHA